MALATAQFLNCENRSKEDSCGTCPSCIKSENFAHPDIHYSFPFITLKGKTSDKTSSVDFLPKWKETLKSSVFFSYSQWMNLLDGQNKQGNINARECLDIIKRLSLYATEGNWKIMLIWLPEFMGVQANRLLKIIEEPPEKTVFILVSENSKKLLNTIKSRCQEYRFAPLKPAEIKPILEQVPDVNCEELDIMIQLSENNINRAVELANKSEVIHSGIFFDWLRKSYHGKPSLIIDWVNAFSKLSREKKKQVLRLSLFYLQKILRFKYGLIETVGLSEEDQNSLQKMASLLELNQIQQIETGFSEAIYLMERYINDKILLTHLSYKIYRAFMESKAIQNQKSVV